MSSEYDYPPDDPTREEMEQVDADRHPPDCICENPQAALYNPDCYWHGTEGVELKDMWVEDLELAGVASTSTDTELRTKPKD